MIFPITKETAKFYTQIKYKLYKKGKPIPINDRWIAASALEHNFAIFTYDQHFKNIDDLVIVNSIDDLMR